MAFDINKSSPGDDDRVSDYPADERGSRTATEGLLGAEHSPTEGRHAFPEGDDLVRDSITNWQKGSLFINTSSTPARLQRQKNAAAPFAWEGFGDFGAGTALLFPQATAPAGWTQDVTANDRVLRVVSGEGGDVGGDWVISGVTVDGHALTISQMPNHDHVTDPLPKILHDSGGGGPDFGWSGPQANTDGNRSVGTSNVGGGAAHGHGLTADGTWRPAYLDVIRATKD